MKSENRFLKVVILGLLILQVSNSSCSLKKKALVYGGITAAALFAGVSFYRNYSTNKEYDECDRLIKSFGDYNIDSHLNKSLESIKKDYLDQEIETEDSFLSGLSCKLMRFNFFKIIGMNEFKPSVLIGEVFTGKLLKRKFKDYNFDSRKVYDLLVKNHTKYLIKKFDHNHVMARLEIINIDKSDSISCYKKNDGKKNTEKFLNRLFDDDNGNLNSFFDKGNLKKRVFYEEKAREYRKEKFLS